jgi:hypothetical protein
MQVMGAEALSNIKYLVDERGRLEAGFDPQEVRVAASQATTRQAMNQAS